MTIGTILAAFGIVIGLLALASYLLGRVRVKEQVAEQTARQVEATAHDVFVVEKTVANSDDAVLRDKLRRASRKS